MQVVNVVDAGNVASHRPRRDPELLCDVTKKQHGGILQDGFWCVCARRTLKRVRPPMPSEVRERILRSVAGSRPSSRSTRTVAIRPLQGWQTPI